MNLEKDSRQAFNMKRSTSNVQIDGEKADTTASGARGLQVGGGRGQDRAHRARLQERKTAGRTATERRCYRGKDCRKGAARTRSSASLPRPLAQAVEGVLGPKTPPICFCETNPPILSWKTGVIRHSYNWLHDRILRKNGGFVLENEPTGEGFKGAKRWELGDFGV